MKINPCPECDNNNVRCGRWDGWFVHCLPVHHDDENKDGCMLSGPHCDTEEQAIAAWNSISTGWRPGDTAPRDGTLILTMWILHDDELDTGDDPRMLEINWWGEDQGVGRWAVSPFKDGRAFDFWHPIPPIPEEA